MPDHCSHRIAGIDEANDDVRMCCLKDSKYFVGESLPEVFNVTQVELDLGKLVEVVQQPFGF